LVAILFDIGKDHDLALLRRKLGEGFGEGFAELSLDVVFDGGDREGALSPERRGGVVFG
jgi:hypothetical protein